MMNLKAKQLTASGLVTGKRALFKQLIVFHPNSSDTAIEFYDRTTAPTGGEVHYQFDVYGKGTDSIPFVDPGILFDDGIYVVFTAVDTTVTVIYEEV
jgi:hypothetical protein